MSTRIPVKILLIFSALLLVFPAAAFSTVVTISPTSAAATLGSQVTVSLEANNVEGLFATQLELRYDPEILEFVSAQEGGFLSQQGIVSTDLSLSTDTPGVLLVYYSRSMDELTGATGSGNLLTITFNTLSAGTSPLNFQTEGGASFLVDPEYNFIDATWNNGEVVVRPQPTPDATPPSTPADLTATAVSSSQVNLSWSTSTDPIVENQITSGLAGYKIYRDSTEIATTTDTFYSDANLTASTTYSYTVSSYDVAGNEYGQSESVSTTTLAEIIPTEVNISPASTTAALGSQVTVSINISNASNLFGAAFDLIFDPGILRFVSAQDETYSCLANTNSTDNSNLIIGCWWSEGINGSNTLINITFEAASVGTSSLVFRANNDSLTDADGNTIPAAWTDGEIVALEPQPTADITSPSIPLNLTTTAISSSQIDLAWSTSTDPVIEGQITSGLAGYKIYRDGIQIATSTETFYSNTGLAASTTYSYAVSAYDEAGNESTSSESTSTTTLAETIPAEISISPANTTAFVNSQFSVSINVNEASNLFGIAFDLIFDPDILNFVSATKGNFLNQDGTTDDLAANFLRDPQGNVIDRGRLIVGYSRLAGSEGPTGINGTGNLMTLTFKPVTTGVSQLTFQRTHLFNPNLAENTANWNGGAVNVEVATICSSFIYSEWGTCQSNNTQSRTIISSLPSGCTAGNPILTQSCVYIPPQTVSSAGNGGTGTTLLPELTISSESIKVTDVTENKITITWVTNHPASSQVIYAQEGEDHNLDLNKPKYGYARISPEYNAPPNLYGTTTHSVTIGDLIAGINYYYRTVSHGSLAISQEYSFTTLSVTPSEEIEQEETKPQASEEESKVIQNAEISKITGETGEEIINKTPEEISEKAQESSQKIAPQEKEIAPEITSEIANQPKNLTAAIGMLWDRVNQSVLLIFSIVSLLLITFLALFSKKCKNIIRRFLT